MYEDQHAGSIFFQDGEKPPAIIPNGRKDVRGFNHIDTAYLLCPLRLQEEFNADPG